jgi:hypothetical protein
MKILFAGNCQVTSLAQIISAAEPKFVCDAKEVWQMSKEDCEAISIADYDAVIAQPLVSERYGKLTQHRLTASCQGKPLLFIHNLHFEAVVPDCTYVGPLGKRVNGPMGTYHSSIVLAAFIEGLSVTSCVKRMERGTNLDVTTTWDDSVAILRQRERAITVPFVDELIMHVKVRRCLHVFNHPNAFLLERYAEKILATLLDRPARVLVTHQPDLLQPIGSWPTYSWLAESLGLPYGEDNFLIPKISADPLPFSEFVERSYAIYAKTPQKDLVI